MNQPQTFDKTDFSLHPSVGVGPVTLTVANLENQIRFYQQALGFKLLSQTGNKASLGSDNNELLHLIEEPNLKKYRGVTGLYHFAVLFPNRKELAIALARLFAIKYRNHPTDHIMTKTTYLDDPEGNGIELYTESPEDGTFTMKDGKFETRRTDGSWSDGREPLDVNALFSLLKEDEDLSVPVPPETHMGHVHLHVRDVDEAVDFYHGVIGFDIMGVAKDFQAAFVSAGGYHHHVGLNTWQGVDAPPPPADAVGLRYLTVEFPNQGSMDDAIANIDKAGVSYNKTDEGILLYDPSQNGVMLRIR